MLTHQVALVSETNKIPFGELARVSAAIQKQIVRDVAPIWNVQATIDAFEKLEDVPIGYWSIIIKENIGAAHLSGLHLDQNGQPYALVNYNASWSLQASRLCIEMLIDPFGNRLVAGQSPNNQQGRVLFLVKPCSPCQAAAYAYTSNGVLVSDFHTPNYFDPIGSKGVRYSFTGAITEPKEVLPNGYLTWYEPVTGEWWQMLYFDKQVSYRSLGKLNVQGSIRPAISRLTSHPSLWSAVDEQHLRRLHSTEQNIAATNAATAHNIRLHIDSLERREE
jgi:hypothetical protein